MSDTKESIFCPACGALMKKVYIDDAKCNIDICADGCGGIFFDNRELKNFDEQHENIDDILTEYKDRTYYKQNDDKTRLCPVCGNKMVKHYTSNLRQVEIDECYSCGGVFLDYGELEQIRSQFKTEERRRESFNNFLNEQYDISDFKDYKAKDVDEFFNKATVKMIDFIKKLI